MNDRARVQDRNLIGGQWVSAQSGRECDVTNPANDALVARVPHGGAEEARVAVDAAAAAMPEWSGRSAHERADVLGSLARLLRERADPLARLLTTEQGKPVSEARGEVVYAATFFESAAEEAKRVFGEIVPARRKDRRILVLRQPVGVTAAITPWNFPIAMIARKLAPALATGCTMVIKPALKTPLSALALGELALEAGVPPGVVNVITGDSTAIAGQLFRDARVRKVGFTGSTVTGKKLMTLAASNVTRLSLELGGHAPFLVFDDADLDAAVTGAVASKYRNAGQTCICANRFYVQSGIYERFASELTKRAAELRVGSGLDEGVSIGPLIDDAAVEKMSEHVDDALAKGGRLRTGGRLIDLGVGWSKRFYAPTVIEGLRSDMLCAREETFGPLSPLARFEQEDEAIELANASPYGLSAYCYTRDLGRAFRIAERLQYGIVGLNDGAPSTADAPFGGVKESGFGREGGHWALDEYLNVKYVSLGV